MTDFNREATETLVRVSEEIAGKVEETAVETYKNIEEGVVDTYRKIEDSIVGAYKKVEDSFVETFLTKDGETVEDAKRRLEEKTARLNPVKKEK